MRPADPIHRFLLKVQEAGGCWLWTGAVRGGYGERYAAFWFERRVVYGHRWIHERLRGPLRPEDTLDHSCRNTLCVNPDHLEVVSRLENTRRQLQARRSASTVGAAPSR